MRTFGHSADKVIQKVIRFVILFL